MGSWYALNVQYVGDDWSMPDVRLTRINAHEHPFDDQGFDLLLDTFQTGVDADHAIGKMVDIALWQGTPSKMVSVVGSDTSDMFSFRQINLEGKVIDKWSDNGYRSQFDDTKRAVDLIEDELGVKPSRGGNYRDYE